MKRDEAFPSKFWKATDLKDGPVTLTIEHVNYEPLKDSSGVSKEKLIAYFKKQKKALVFESIASFCGEDSEDWPGQKITLFADTTQLAGKRVDCVRVRRPAAKKPEPPSAGADFDDEVPPFGDA